MKNMEEMEKTKITGIYIATYSEKEKTGKIWLFNNKKPEIVAERPKMVSRLCVHNGNLYDGGHYNKIFNTLEDPKGKDPVAVRKKSINCLCSHNGTLYDAGNYKIFNTLEDPKGKEPVAVRKSLIEDLCSHNGKLYDGGFYHKIFNTLEDPKGKEPVADRGYFFISHLCSHNGRLYDSTGTSRVISDTLKYPEGRVASRPGSIYALCSHNGKLYDAVEMEIYDTLEDPKGTKPLVHGRGGGDVISTLCSHAGKLYEGWRWGRMYNTLENKLIYDFKESIITMCSF